MFESHSGKLVTCRGTQGKPANSYDSDGRTAAFLSSCAQITRSEHLKAAASPQNRPDVPNTCRLQLHPRTAQTQCMDRAVRSSSHKAVRRRSQHTQLVPVPPIYGEPAAPARVQCLRGAYAQARERLELATTQRGDGCWGRAAAVKPVI